MNCKAGFPQQQKSAEEEKETRFRKDAWMALFEFGAGETTAISGKKPAKQNTPKEMDFTVSTI